MKKKSVEDDKKIKVSTLLYACATVLVAVIGVMSVLAYGTQTKIGAKIASSVSKIVPFPAAVIDWKNVVSTSGVKSNLTSLEKFYATQDFATEGLRVDFTTESGRKRLRIKEREIMDKMVEDKAIEILAKEKGVSISKKDVEQAVSQKLNEFGTADDVKADLARSYGWSMDDFKERVVLPSMYADALAQKVATEELDNSQAKEKIKQAQSQLETGKDFAEVVRNYSEGSSKGADGELGWVKKAQIAPELGEALFGAEPIAKNAIIESSIGFHIVDVKNSKKEEGQDVLQIRQVFVAKKTFADWLIEKKKQMKIFIPLRDFVWDSNAGMVDFKDEEMRIFEKEQRAKAQGDASIMF